MSNKLYPPPKSTATPAEADKITFYDVSNAEEAEPATMTTLRNRLVLTGGTAAVPAEADVITFADASNSNAAADATIEKLRQAIGQVITKDVVVSGTAVSTGDGTAAIPVPAVMNGLELSAATATVHDKGITGTTDIQLRRVRVESALGASDTQFDITNPSGTTARYTYDGTGTNPEISDALTSLKAGDQIDIQAENFSSVNNGLFTITGVGANYFEIDNASLLAETDKTIGTGSITPIKHRDMLSTKITIGDEFYASDGVINTSYDDLQTGDKIYIDIDAVHSGTAPNGLAVALYFKL